MWQVESDPAGVAGAPMPAGPLVSADTTTRASYYVDPVDFTLQPARPGVEEKVVLITIDDTPHDTTTLAMLDVLDEHEARALFFVNGYLLEGRRGILKEIVDRGHVLGNHSWSHNAMDTLSRQRTWREIQSVNEELAELSGEHPVYFRAPYGIMTPYIQDVIDEMGMQGMNWSLMSQDWTVEEVDDYQEVVKTTMKHMHKGANILLHDRPVTARALPHLLEELREEGYGFAVPDSVVHAPAVADTIGGWLRAY